MAVATTIRTTACTTGVSTGRQLAHHWRIDEPEGAWSFGKCIHCGEGKMFLNWLGNDFLTNEEQRVLRLVTT